MPDIHFECPKCAQSIDAPEELASQFVECPTCKDRIEVPTPSLPVKPTGSTELHSSPVQRASQSPPRIASFEYSVVPFVAFIAHGKSSDAAAAQLQRLINSCASDGWEYVRLESVETCIEGDNGCFGVGATPPRTTVG